MCRALSLLAGLMLALPLTANAEDCAPGVLDLRDSDSQLRFRVEIADDEQGRASGLMHREEMPQFSGMLFVYDQPGPVAFWMKNTLIPLDMLFFDETGDMVTLHENAVPLDESPIFGGNNILYVLEINGGLAAELGIGDDTQLRHPVVDPELAVWACPQ